MPSEGVSVQKAKEMSQEERERLLRKIEQHAHDYEVVYWGCSQAVLYTLQRHLQLDDGGAFRAASPFAGGVARMREVCGALVGGVMAIGLAYGRTKFEAGKVALEQPLWGEILKEISRIVPRKTTLTGLYLRTGKTAKELRLKGVTFGGDAEVVGSIVEIMEGLEKSLFFKDVRLSSSEENKEYSEQGGSFEIRCEILDDRIKHRESSHADIVK